MKQGWNWRIWTGFLLALVAIPGYFLFFARFPVTRDVPWASWLMFAVAGWLLWAGIRQTSYDHLCEFWGQVIGKQ